MSAVQHEYILCVELVRNTETSPLQASHSAQDIDSRPSCVDIKDFIKITKLILRMFKNQLFKTFLTIFNFY